jgi:hypothetical protein
MKTFSKFKTHLMYMLIIACPLMLGGAKYWHDPASLADAQNCANGACCAKCVETMETAQPQHMEGWQWRLQVATHYSR